MSAQLTYTLGRSLYLALTNRCNSATLIETRGPGFALRESSGFTPLDEGFEPTAAEALAAVSAAYATAADGFDAVVFAGVGEPLLRLRVLEEASRAISTAHAPPALRLNTNGLVAGSSADDVATRLRDAGVTAASVALMSADPEQYQELMRPERLRLSPAFSLPLGHADVCRFTTACLAAGIDVECTAVEHPAVDVDAARAFAQRLGATFRARSWHGPP